MDGPLMAHLSSCHKERMLTIKYKSNFSKSLVHLWYHSDHKDYQFTKFNQNLLICTVSMSELFTHSKMPGCTAGQTCILFYKSIPLI